MDKRQNLELIADISNANGAPGFEDDVVAQIRRHAEELAFSSPVSSGSSRQMS